MGASRRPFTRTPCGLYGTRHLALRHARRVKEVVRGKVRETTTLKPGEENLYSFYAPGLEGGKYTVSVDQVVTAPSTNETQTFPQADSGTPATQDFEVVVPRYNLPDDAVYSSFPTQGTGALGNTLPHVALTDPHLPWDRLVSKLPNKTSPDWHRNQVPWLAVLAFTPEELTLSEAELSGPDGIFQDTSLKSTKVQQTQTLSVRMPVPDIPKLQHTVSPVTRKVQSGEPSSQSSSADVVFVPAELFAELVTRYDDDGNSLRSEQDRPDLSRYKYLAHVRDINTTGMADAGTEDNGMFGIVVSHRVGPLTATQPRPTVAHLVSIEDCESDYMRDQWPDIVKSSTRYVALSSLYSWTYLTLPPGSFDIATALRNLSQEIGLLRAPNPVISAMGDPSLQSRLRDGFTMTKYRTMTGEETAAFSRGPFTPTRVPYPLRKTPGHEGGKRQSNSGIDLQALDPDVGLMDITYSAAWQLGKTLAVADQTFTTALGRLRSFVQAKTMDTVKAKILAGKSLYRTREQTIRSLLATLPALNKLHKQTGGLFAPHGSISDRWLRPETEAINLSYDGEAVQALFASHADRIGRELMGGSSNGSSSDLGGNSESNIRERYDELNAPDSVEWMVVLKWVLDKLYFYGLPAHYLMIDPSYLPLESVRFFHIDRNWTDALIDGALSIGNHGDTKDLVRRTIVGMINEQLYPTKGGVVPPQIPTFGFLLRSDIVTQAPDLRVTVNLDPSIDTAPILRQDILDPTQGVMLCLLDQLPGDGGGLQSVQFTQPPHQQTFIAGFHVDATSITTHYRHMFTLPGQKPNSRSLEEHSWSRDENTTNPGDSGVEHAARIFKWGSNSSDLEPKVRTLLFPAWATDVSATLNYYGGETSPKFYDDPVANSAMAGIQLNNPIYRLTIGELDEYSRGSSGAHLPPPITARFPPMTQSSTVLAPSPGRSQIATSAGQDTHTQLLPHRSRPEATSATSATSSGGPGRAPRLHDGFELGPGHGNVSMPPPYSRPLRALPIPLPSQEPLPGDPPTLREGVPVFKTTVVPVDNNRNNPGVRCGTGIPADLVFRINQKQVGGHQQQQQQQQIKGDIRDGDGQGNLEYYNIYLQLPTEKPSDVRRDASCLMKSYEGPGPFMLSNVRFVVQAQIDDVKTSRIGLALVLRVVPRSTTGAVPASQCQDLSFILPVCRIPKRDLGVSVPVWLETKARGFSAQTMRRVDVVQLAW